MTFVISWNWHQEREEVGEERRNGGQSFHLRNEGQDRVLQSFGKWPGEDEGGIK